MVIEDRIEAKQTIGKQNHCGGGDQLSAPAASLPASPSLSLFLPFRRAGLCSPPPLLMTIHAMHRLSLLDLPLLLCYYGLENALASILSLLYSSSTCA